jgi:HK97 family phage portal protein
VQAAREAVAGYLQTESYGVDIFAAGVPHGTLSTDQALPEETLRRYADAWRADARNSVRVLSGGLTFTPFKLAPRDAAWLEARAYDAAEVARIFNIPAHKLNLAVSGGMTYNNAETLDRDFLRGLAAGYLRPVETAFGRLLSPGRGEHEETAVSYDYSAFMRATTAERYSAYQSAIAGGWLTVDEVRAMEGMPPLSET